MGSFVSEQHRNFRQVLYLVIDDRVSQHISKSKPVGFGRAHEPVKGIFREVFFERTGTLLHIHATTKNVTHLITKKRNGWNAFFFGSVALLQKLADFIGRKNLLNTFKNSYLVFRIL